MLIIELLILAYFNDSCHKNIIAWGSTVFGLDGALFIAKVWYYMELAPTNNLAETKAI